jgi:formylglycine-generating enzyme required for sulfatase activity
MSEPVNNNPQEIFISYAWGGNSEEFVNQLDRAFQNKGIKIIRDKRDLGYKGLIKEFMESIGRGKCVITVINDKYLKSPNCMFELVHVSKNGAFHDRVFPIVLPDAQINNPVERIKYIKHWEDQINTLNEAMRSVSAANLQGFREEIDQYSEIRTTIAELTALLKNMNTLTADLHSQNDFDALFKAISNRLIEATTTESSTATMEHQSQPNSSQNQPSPKSPQLKTFQFEVVELGHKGQEVKRNKSHAECFIEQISSNIDLEMVKIPGGTFLMGSPDGVGDVADELPQHSVTVASFFMGKYPITQAQWYAVAAMDPINRELTLNPAKHLGANLPVECISWHDALEFCDRLSLKTSRKYHLPSEAEWEYACRAGTTTKYHFGDSFNRDFFNFTGLTVTRLLTAGFSALDQATTAVGSFKVANSFGLYDMHGNVWEWCADHWQYNYKDKPKELKQNGNSPWLSNDKNPGHLCRGGGYGYGAENCRSTSRKRSRGTPHYGTGFRVVLSLS